MGVGGQCHAPVSLSPGKTRYPLYRRLGGLQGQCGQVRKISSPLGFNPQPVASRYTDWAIMAPDEWTKQSYNVACHVNLLTPNDDYSGHTAPLTSKCCILYIYSTNIGTQYFKHGIYSPFFPLQNAVCFINLTYLVPVLFTFYIQSVLKLKKK